MLNQAIETRYYADTPEKFYITTKGCAGILRRKHEHKAGMNKRLEIVLNDCLRNIALA